MIRYPLLQIVDAPHVDATVVADLNAHYGADVIAEKDGFSLGAPSLSGDAGHRRRTWGKRRLTLPVFVAGDRAVAVAQHRVLARAVTRDGWVRFQLSPDTDSVWFRTYATEQGPVSFDLFHSSRSGDDLWRFELALDADQFAVGSEVTLGPYTVSNTTPTSGGMRVKLPEIEGDMPAPAAVKIVRLGGKIHGPAVSVSERQPRAWTVSAWGANAGLPVTQGTYIGGSYRPTSGDLSSWGTVANWEPLDMPPGRWRFMVRLSGSSDAGAFAARLRFAAGPVNVDTAPVVIDVRAQRRWVELGTGPWPLGDASGLGFSSTSGTVSLQVQRLDAGGDLLLDTPLVMIPVDDESTLLTMQLANVFSNDTWVLADAAARRSVVYSSSTTQRTPAVRGGWPTLHPGRDNHLMIFQNLMPTPLANAHDEIATPSTVTVTYRPQYLWGVA